MFTAGFTKTSGTLPGNLLGARGGIRSTFAKPARVDHPSLRSITGVSQTKIQRHRFGEGKPLSLQSRSSAGRVV